MNQAALHFVSLTLAAVTIALVVSRVAAEDGRPAFVGGTTLPQVGPSPPKETPAATPTPVAQPCQATVSEKAGIVALDLSDATRAGRAAMITVDDIIYAASFDSAGQLHLEAPIFHAIADLSWTGQSNTYCRRNAVAFDNFASAAFTALIWEGPYDLNLNVVEPPDGRVGGPVRYVYPGRPNTDLKTGWGFLRSFGQPVAGTSRVWLYTLPSDRNPGPEGFFYFIEFASRGNPARPPYCGGDGEFATADFRLLHLAPPSPYPEKKHLKIRAASCGFSWNTDEESWTKVKW
jgi:hypothetical protein